MSRVLVALVLLLAAGCATVGKDEAAFDVAPVPVFEIRPFYPRDLADRHVEGKVTVNFFVETDGSVQEASAAQFTNAEFEAAAIECVKHWKFRPALKNGVPVRAQLGVPIIFQMN